MIGVNIMMIYTNKAIMNNPNCIVDQIAEVWDKISLGWRAVWGPHIHHGFYETTESAFSECISPLAAQEKLLDKICSLLSIKEKSKILDVGCGMGGTALYLAKKYHSEVIGITLSRAQLKIAKQEIEDEIKKGLKNDTRRSSGALETSNASESTELSNLLSFKIADAHKLNDFSDNYFDIVWSLESCEQFYDKEQFINEALRVLKPGGKLMIATWCASGEYYIGDMAKNYIKLCKAFQLPYMPSINHYQKILESRTKLTAVYDWSSYVKQSWDIGIDQLKKFSWFKLFRMGGLTGIHFVRNLKLMRNAFTSGQLRYAVFVAEKA